VAAGHRPWPRRTHIARQRIPQRLSVPGVRSGRRVCRLVRDSLPVHRAAGYGQWVTGAIVIGVAARTGSAVAIALSGAAGVPRFRGRREIALVPQALTAQPYRAAAGMDLAVPKS
jgi:hypothetical protein